MVDRPVRVALVEDHAPTRAVLVQSLSDFQPRLNVVNAFGDAESFLASEAHLHAEVVLTDLSLPSMQGSELIRVLAERAPAVRVLALTSFADENNVLEAIRAGAFGYLLKDEPPVRLFQAIEEAAAGASPISSRVAGFLLTQARRAPPPVALSDREVELAKALADGLSYAECATRMGIALGTVQDYVKRVYRKLNVNSRNEVRDWVARYTSNR